MSAFFAKITAFFMAILAFFGLAKPTQKPIQIEGGCKVEIVNRDISISVNSNPSTGYEWTYTQRGSSIEFVSKNYSTPIYRETPGKSMPAIIGAGGIETFKFKAVEPGQTVLSFKYERSWEVLPAAEELTLTVEVAQDMSVEYLIWE